MTRAVQTPHARRDRVGLMVVVAAVSAAVAVAAWAAGLLSPLEYRSIDARFTIRGVQRRPADVVVVGIDNATLNEAPGTGLGRPPYPRRVDALVIRHLLAAGARAVVFDLQFIEQTDPADDNALIQAVSAAHGRVVLADTDVGAGGSTPVLGGLMPLKGSRAAFAGLPVDGDGALRSYPESFDGGGPRDCCLDSIAVAAVETFTHRRVRNSLFPGGNAPIDFPGPPGTVREIPFVAVSGVPANPAIQVKAAPPSFSHAAVRGKIVVVGAFDRTLQDVHTTSFGPIMSGPEIWADAISTLLRGNPLRFASGLLDVLVIIALGIAAPLARLRMRAAFVLAFAIALAGGYAVATQFAFDGGTILTFSYPLLALLFGTASSQAADVAFERRRNRALQGELDRLPGEQADFLISYRRDQSSWPARILTGALTERFGDDSVFKDTDSISAGEQWPQRIATAIAACDVMLVLIGPRWTDAAYADGSRRIDDPEDWVRREIETGLAATCAVVPVLHDGARMPDDGALPPSLRPLAHRNAYSLTPEHWDEQLEELLVSIREGRIRSFLAAEAATGDEGAPATAVDSARSAPDPRPAARPALRPGGAPVPPADQTQRTPPIPRAAPAARPRSAPAAPSVPPLEAAPPPPAPAPTVPPVPPPAIAPADPSRRGAMTSTPLGRRPDPTTSTVPAVVSLGPAPLPRDAPNADPEPLPPAERAATASSLPAADPPPAPAPLPRIPRRPR